MELLLDVKLRRVLLMDDGGGFSGRGGRVGGFSALLVGRDMDAYYKKMLQVDPLLLPNYARFL